MLPMQTAKIPKKYVLMSEPNLICLRDTAAVTNCKRHRMLPMQTAKIPEKYVLMSEPDHIWLRPLPNFMTGDRPAAFNFG